MTTDVAPSEGLEGIPSPSSSPLGVPPWREWVERIHATPGRMQWPCPLADCQAVLPSAAFAAEHLIDWHGWTEYDIAEWWAKDTWA